MGLFIKYFHQQVLPLEANSLKAYFGSVGGKANELELHFDICTRLPMHSRRWA